MASKNTVILFLVLNLLLFSLANAKKKPPCSKPPSAMPPSSKPPSAMPPSLKPPSVMPPAAMRPSNCPIDALKLNVCAKVLNGLLGVTIGTPPKQQCCSLIKGLAGHDAAICLCTAIKANVLGINLDVPLSINLLLNACGSNYPDGFTCGSK